MRRLFTSALAMVSLLCGGWMTAAAQAVPNRIAQEINPNETAVLKGSVSPRVTPEARVGSMAASTPIDGITLFFQPTAEQKAAMDALVKAQQTPGSPEYHQWLTPAQYANEFGMSQADIEKVESWLESQGFNVERVSNSRTSIVFSGTVEQVETAFRTDMGEYVVNGEKHWANATELSIPAALTGIVQSVTNLNDFRPKPMMRPSRMQSAKPQPDYTWSGNGDHFMTPADVATIYNMNPAYNAGDDGAGVTIAVVGQSEIEASDIQDFDSAAGITFHSPTMTLVPGTGVSTVSSGDEAESDLDVEYSGATAKGASVNFVYVGSNPNDSVFNALQYAIDHKIGAVISISYGGCEASLPSGFFASEEQILQQGALQGQSIVASSGDNGSTSCWGYSNLTTAQQEALGVNYPASSVYVTGIGGTEFPTADVASTNSQYWQSSNGTGGGSAVSYIPEQAWNDDTTCGPAATQQKNPSVALCSTGGGVSVLAARPSWQTGVSGIPSGSMRVVPDVSLDASNVNAPYLFCTSDTSAWSSGQQASCNSGFLDAASQDPTAAGGTSFAAPIFAGMLAIIDQKTSSEQGVAAAELYTLAANGATYSAAFHDTPSGSGNQCTAGSSYCSSAGASEYPTTAGYDEATGLGSVNFSNLMNAWSGSTAPLLAATTTTATAQTANLTAGTNDVISITVAPQSGTGTPTGTVEININGTQATTVPLASGAASYTFSSTVNGTYTIDAIYSGDANFQGSTGTASVTVTGGTNPPGFTLSANPTTVTVTSGNSGTSTISVTPQTGYTGTVDFQLAVTGTNATSLETYGCYSLSSSTDSANGSVTISSAAAATTTLTLYTSESQCTSSGSMRPGFRAFARVRPAGGSAKNQSPFGGTVPLGAATLGGLLLFGVRRSRSRIWTMLGCLMLMTAVGGFASGCGSSTAANIGGTTGGGGTTTSSTDVPAGNYSLTMTGTDSVNTSVTSAVNLTLTVN